MIYYNIHILHIYILYNIHYNMIIIIIIHIYIYIILCHIPTCGGQKSHKFHPSRTRFQPRGDPREKLVGI